MGAGPDFPIETGIPREAQVDSKGDYTEKWRTFIGRGREELTILTPAVEGSVRHNPNLKEDE